jgi:hypothetical protein
MFAMLYVEPHTREVLVLHGHTKCHRLRKKPSVPALQLEEDTAQAQLHIDDADFKILVQYKMPINAMRARKMIQSRIRKLSPTKFKAYALSAQNVMKKYKITGAQNMIQKLKSNPKLKASIMRLGQKYKLVTKKDLRKR